MSRGQLIAEARAWSQALSLASRAAKPAAKFVGSAKHDVKGAVRAHRYLTDRSRQQSRGFHRELLQTRALGAVAKRNVRNDLDFSNRMVARARTRRSTSVANLSKKGAMIAAGTAIGVAAVGMGIRAGKKFRNRKTQYRHYDVHPEHQYGVSPVERFNRPYYNDDQGGPPRVHEARELPKRLTGFQLRRRKYRWTGIKNKMRSMPTSYRKWIKSKVGANKSPKGPLKQNARKAVQTPQDIAKGKRAISRHVSTLPQEDKIMDRGGLIKALAEAGGAIQPSMAKKKQHPVAKMRANINRGRSSAERTVQKDSAAARSYHGHRQARRTIRAGIGIGAGAFSGHAIASKHAPKHHGKITLAGAATGAVLAHRRNKLKSPDDHNAALKHVRKTSFERQTAVAAGRSDAKRGAKVRKSMRESERTGLINAIIQACA